MHQIPDLSISFTVGTDGEGRPKSGSFSTREFVQHMVRSGRQFNSDFNGIRMGGRIDDATRVKSTGPFQVDSQDWEALVVACKDPSPIGGMPAYPLSPAAKCVPLVEAVLEAKKVADPKPKRR